MSIDFSNLARVSRLAPQRQADANEVEMRCDPYGNQAVNVFLGTKHNLTDEGCYVVATTPTPGTAVAYGSSGTQTSFSDTTGFVVWYNGAQATLDNAPRMYLDYLRILVSGTVPASSTSTQFAIKIDSISRAPTANATQITPVNLLLATPNATYGKFWVPSAGVPTVPASGPNARLVSRGTLRTGISVTLEEYELRFGTVDGVAGGVQSAAGKFVNTAPPVVLGPGESAVLFLWQPSGATNALSCEIETAWIER